MSTQDRIPPDQENPELVKLSTGADYALIYREPKLGNCPPGTQFSLTAYPNKGYYFVDWYGDISSTDNPVLVTVNKDMEIFARCFVFEPPPGKKPPDEGTTGSTVIPIYNGPTEEPPIKTGPIPPGLDKSSLASALTKVVSNNFKKYSELCTSMTGSGQWANALASFSATFATDLANEIDKFVRSAKIKPQEFYVQQNTVATMGSATNQVGPSFSSPLKPDNYITLDTMN
jgi:hypothetical protein